MEWVLLRDVAKVIWCTMDDRVLTLYIDTVPSSVRLVVWFSRDVIPDALHI